MQGYRDTSPQFFYSAGDMIYNETKPMGILRYIDCASCRDTETSQLFYSAGDMIYNETKPMGILRYIDCASCRDTEIRLHNFSTVLGI